MVMTGKELLDMAEKQLGQDVLLVTDCGDGWALVMGNRKTGEPDIILGGGHYIDLKTKKAALYSRYDLDKLGEPSIESKEYTYEEACKIELDD